MLCKTLYANKLSRGNFKHIAKGTSFEPGLAKKQTPFSVCFILGLEDTIVFQIQL